MMKKMSPILKWILIGIGVFILIGIIAVIDGDDEQKNPKTETISETKAPETADPVIMISAAKLYNEYEENEIAADNKFKDKKIQVSGKIESIGKDITGEPYITLYSGEFSFSVQCFLEDGHNAANLKRGQIVFIVGRCEGKAIMNVILRNSYIVYDSE